MGFKKIKLKANPVLEVPAIAEPAVSAELQSPNVGTISVSGSCFTTNGLSFSKIWTRDINKFQNPSLNYKQKLDSTFKKYCRFLQSEAPREAHLVLGKVQSGKTANMIYTIAWAKDNGFDGVIILTGVTESLNKQTRDRMLAEIGQNASNPDYKIANVIEVPRPKEKTFFNNAKILIDGREIRIPVFVSLKNAPRLKMVKKMLSDYPAGSKILIIDDEADQVSQDGNSNNVGKQSTKIHLALADIYNNTPHKTLLLSYTATPQAILLTDRNSPIKPNFCSTILPRDGYFGITDIATSKIFRNSNSEEMDENTELENAIWDTVFAAHLRKHFPDKFYKNYNPSRKYNKSVQMLVHQSNKKQAHSDTKKSIQEILDDINEVLQSSGGEKLIAKQLSRYNEDGKREIKINDKHYSEITKLFSSIHLTIINSDFSADERAVSDSDYEVHPIWIIVGGDIVGRGVTIPQLVTSFHTRNGTNFDTVLQQMRLCGYRKEYKHMLRMYTTPEIMDFLSEMAYSDTVLWSQVSDWDAQDTDLTTLENPIYFVSYSAQKMDPTRKGVQDRNTQDRSISNFGQTVVSLKHIFEPEDFVNNLQVLNTLSTKFEGVHKTTSKNKEWILFEEIDDYLSRRWYSSHKRDSEKLALFNNLFNLPSNGEFFQSRHITNFPIQLLVDTRLIEMAGKFKELDAPSLAGLLDGYDSSNSTYSYRVVDTKQSLGAEHFPNPDDIMTDWISAATSEYSENTQQEKFRSIRLASPHIGTPQRGLIKDSNVLPPHLKDGITFIVEPVFGVNNARGSGKSQDIVCFGIALSAVMDSQNRVCVRIVGHGEEITDE